MVTRKGGGDGAAPVSRVSQSDEEASCARLFVDDGSFADVIERQAIPLPCAARMRAWALLICERVSSAGKGMEWNGTE